MVFEAVTNLAIMDGDASKVLPERCAAGSVAELFINFPEPPLWSGGGGETKWHLLTAEFFDSVHRALTPGGMMTIYSDNLGYCKTLAQTLGEGGLFESVVVACPAAEKDTPTGRWIHEKQPGGITVYGGYPGRDGGHISQQTSYFDRFWDKGQKSRRYFIFVRRKGQSQGTGKVHS